MIKTFIVVLGLFAFGSAMRVDQYDAFRTTRYYSTNRQYFVEVTRKRRAILYRNARGQAQLVWSRTLPALPRQLLVGNDGNRVAIIDRYYGNASDPSVPAVILLDGEGNELASHPLSEVAVLSGVIKTTSGAQWYRDVKLTADGSYLIIETLIAKRDPATCKRVSSPEEAEECSRSAPYEQLRFSTHSGKLTSRIRIGASVTVSSH